MWISYEHYTKVIINIIEFMQHAKSLSCNEHAKKKNYSVIKGLSTQNKTKTLILEHSYTFYPTPIKPFYKAVTKLQCSDRRQCLF